MFMSLSPSFHLFIGCPFGVSEPWPIQCNVIYEVSEFGSEGFTTHYQVRNL